VRRVGLSDHLIRGAEQRCEAQAVAILEFEIETALETSPGIAGGLTANAWMPIGLR